jgi:hypothetical protein
MSQCNGKKVTGCVYTGGSHSVPHRQCHMIHAGRHVCCRRSSSDLYKGLDACAVGDTVELEVLRQDSRERVPITLEPSS